MRKALAATTALLLLAGCWGSGSELTESGEGLPQVTVEFPPTVEAGSIESATVTVANPGPGDMDSLVVSFGLLGTAELPDPIVAPSGPGLPSSVLSVDPEPVRTSPDGVVYEFSSLSEGESVTIVFELRMPETPGDAGNSVVVAEGADPERARGDRLLTDVQE